uniref:Uncharacterized protein n=1 Tax=Romanomermis culicivorax TaxID=13658 RepID=A0A915KFG1_ROMCU
MNLSNEKFQLTTNKSGIEVAKLESRNFALHKGESSSEQGRFYTATGRSADRRTIMMLNKQNNNKKKRVQKDIQFQNGRIVLLVYGNEKCSIK